MDTEQLRQKLLERIEQTKHANKESKDAKRCTHDKQIFKQTIVPGNDKFHGQAYFVYTACVGCKTKVLRDYVVE